jgi:hypothetical protein
MYQTVEISKAFSPDFLECTLVFYMFSRFFFEFLKFSKFEFKNHRFLISYRTDPYEFQKMRPNILTLIVGKYLDIFARESRKSASKQLSHLH